MMSLKDCMEYAVENAAQVQVQRTKEGDARLDRRDAILTAFTPSIEASTYGYYRWGRSIDPETNTYVTTTSLNNGWSVSAGITLFDGFSALNNIKIAKTSLSMGLTRERQEEVTAPPKQKAGPAGRPRSRGRHNRGWTGVYDI